MSITFTRHYPNLDHGSQHFFSVQNRSERNIPGCQPLTEEDTAYHGKFPSKDVCDFVNACKEKMHYFDDGMRMAYGRPDHVAFIPYTVAAE